MNILINLWENTSSIFSNVCRITSSITLSFKGIQWTCAMIEFLLFFPSRAIENNSLVHFSLKSHYCTNITNHDKRITPENWKERRLTLHLTIAAAAFTSRKQKISIKMWLANLDEPIKFLHTFAILTLIFFTAFTQNHQATQQGKEKPTY